MNDEWMSPRSQVSNPPTVGVIYIQIVGYFSIVFSYSFKNIDCYWYCWIVCKFETIINVNQPTNQMGFLQLHWEFNESLIAPLTRWRQDWYKALISRAQNCLYLERNLPSFCNLCYSSAGKYYLGISTDWWYLLLTFHCVTKSDSYNTIFVK